MLHHSDRGVQYAADAFAQLTAAWGVTRSMSCTGNPYDNRWQYLNTSARESCVYQLLKADGCVVFDKNIFPARKTS